MGLAERGHVHRVAVFRREGFFLDRVEAACGPVIDLGIRRMFSLETQRAVVRLADWLREERIDVVHLWDIDAVIFGSMAARKAGLPYITSRRDMAQIYPAHKIAMMRYADRRAAGIVANAEAIKAMLESEGRRLVRVIPNILDLAEFDRQAERAGTWAEAEARIMVGMVARLDPEKDAATFIRGLSLARETEPRLHGVIAGEGSDRPGLEARAATNGGKEAFTFLGEVDEVPALIRHLKAGVLVPSRNEGLSNTILEYMAGRLPVIATDCGGNRELVNAETGWLIPPGDPGELARCLLELAADLDEAEARGQAGRKLVEHRHRADAVCKRFALLYDEVARD